MQHEVNRAIAHCGYTTVEYNTLPGIDVFIDPVLHAESKSMVIARYRTDQLLEAIQQDIMISESKRKK
jgi:hypothetical protein